MAGRDSRSLCVCLIEPLEVVFTAEGGFLMVLGGVGFLERVIIFFLSTQNQGVFMSIFPNQASASVRDRLVASLLRVYPWLKCSHIELRYWVLDFNMKLFFGGGRC